MTTPSTYKLGYPPLKYSTVPSVTLDRDPTTSDLYHPTVGGFYPIPTMWTNKTTGAAFVLVSITGGTTANWAGITSDAEGAVIGPASATNNSLAVFDGTSGKLIRSATATVGSAGSIIFPVGAGVVLTAGGASTRKGASAFSTGGVSPAIATTAIQTDSVVCVTRTNLAGATASTGYHVTITPGVSFTVTSGDAADTSSFTWAIVG